VFGGKAMIKTKAARLTTTAFVCLMLQGCGGDGGGSVASTPTPPNTPPPAGANASLLGTLKSETFVNDASQGSLNVVSAVNATATASAATAAFVYDAGSQTYTMTVAGKSQSFGPSSIDASLSNSEITTYVVKSGQTTDTLTLTKAGTSGHDTYQYVGAAFWQNTTVTSNTSGNGNFYAVAYGEPTPASGVPTTGTASYGIDLIGAENSGFSNQVAVGFVGTGTVNVNFATGALALSGTAAGGSFSGGANLSSSGTFSGAFDLQSSLINSQGQMAGRLYGPTGQEIGGTFSTNGNSGSSAGTDTYATAGVFIGRSQTAPATDTSFASLVGADLLNADSTSQNGNAPATLATASVGLISDANGVGVAFIAPKSALAQADSGLPYSNVYNQTSVGYALGGRAAAGTSGLTMYDLSQAQYVQSGTYFDKSGTNPVYDQFTFGFETPGSAVPRIGYAAFTTFIDGILAPANSTANATEVTGSGQIGVNFATGSMTTTAVLQNVGANTLGTLDGTGTLSSTANTFSGALTLAGSTAYTGTWQGRLYGPAATEVGAVFAAKGTDGSSLSGAMVGVYDPTVIDPTATLPSLSQQATFTTAEASYTGASPTYPAYQSEVFSGVTQITYDPATKTYTVAPITTKYNPGQLTAMTPVTLTPADVVSAQSDATFTAYVTPSTTGRIFNSGAANPVIQLSYVSFAELTQQPVYNSISYPVDHFQIFGIETAASAVPTAGTGSYSGVVYGRGNVYALGAGDVSIGGTGQLSANFALGTWSSTLNLNATPIGGGATTTIGSISYSGPIQGASIYSTSNPGTGQMAGKFYGPAANEVGASWAFNNGAIASPATTYSVVAAGVFVGKKF